MTDCALGSDFRTWCNRGELIKNGVVRFCHRPADHKGDHCTRYLDREHLTFEQVAPKHPGRTTA